MIRDINRGEISKADIGVIRGHRWKRNGIVEIDHRSPNKVHDFTCKECGLRIRIASGIKVIWLFEEGDIIPGDIEIGKMGCRRRIMEGAIG